jgi:hypothetical protein
MWICVFLTENFYNYLLDYFCIPIVYWTVCDPLLVLYDILNWKIYPMFKIPGPGWLNVVGLPNNSYKPITNTAWVRDWLCKKGCTRLAATTDKVYQLLALGRWFSPGAPASSTTKASRHDITEIQSNLPMQSPVLKGHFFLVLS